MPENFLEIQKEYLRKVCLRPPKELGKVLPAQRLGNCFCFRAFGEPCELEPHASVPAHRERGVSHRLEGPNTSFRWRLSILLLLLPCFVSCAGVSRPEHTQASRMIQNVPFHPQEEFQCGPASLAGVLSHWNINVSPEEIASEIYSKSAKGSLNIDMVLYAEKRGLKARQYRGSLEDIKNKIDLGYPLIVLVDEGFLVYQKNHFMIVLGYGEEGIFANSGREQHKFIPAKDFLRSWKRAKFWTLLITPK